MIESEKSKHMSRLARGKEGNLSFLEYNPQKLEVKRGSLPKGELARGEERFYFDVH